MFSHTLKKKRRLKNKTRKQKRNEDKSSFQFKSDNYIKRSHVAGYGIFAGKHYNIGDTVEICPFVSIKCKYLEDKNNPLRAYVFSSHLDNDSELVVFGNGSIFNHDDEPNVYYFHNCSGNRLLYFAAKKEIHSGEELFISYGKSHSVTVNPKERGEGVKT